MDCNVYFVSSDALLFTFHFCRTIHPVKYLHDYLVSILYVLSLKKHKIFYKEWCLQEQGIRTDSRKFLSFRPVSINVSSIRQADSSAIFKLGDTTAVCGIKAVSASHNFLCLYSFLYLQMLYEFYFLI